MLAELSVDVVMHVLLNFTKTYAWRNLLPTSLDSDASARCYGFGDGPVDPRTGLLHLGHHVQNASVANQVFPYCFLKLIAEQVLHRPFHPSAPGASLFYENN